MTPGPQTAADWAAATKRPSPAMKQAQQRLQAAIAKRREELRKPA